MIITGRNLWHLEVLKTGLENFRKTTQHPTFPHPFETGGRGGKCRTGEKVEQDWTQFNYLFSVIYFPHRAASARKFSQQPHRPSVDCSAWRSTDGSHRTDRGHTRWPRLATPHKMAQHTLVQHTTKMLVSPGMCPRVNTCRTPQTLPVQGASISG